MGYVIVPWRVNYPHQIGTRTSTKWAFLNCQGEEHSFTAGPGRGVWILNSCANGVLVIFGHWNVPWKMQKLINSVPWHYHFLRTFDLYWRFQLKKMEGQFVFEKSWNFHELFTKELRFSFRIHFGGLKWLPDVLLITIAVSICCLGLRLCYLARP